MAQQQRKNGLLRRLAPRNDVKTQVRDLAAHPARGLLETSCPLISEGAGNAGRLMRPQPRVQMKKAHEQVTTVTPEITRHSPRNGFNGFLRALPGDRALLPPSSAELPPPT
jgi:hypothetical protein